MLIKHCFGRRFLSTTTSDTNKIYSHTTVLLEETTRALKIKPNGIYLDCTFGNGGNSRRILETYPSTTVYAIDRDPIAFQRAQTLSRQYLVSNNNNDNGSGSGNAKSRLIPIHSKFSRAIDHLKEMKGQFDGIVMDLGVSSMQIDDPSRGFSYKKNGPLDMRMSGSSDESEDEEQITAYDIVNFFPPPEIEKILVKYGDERYAKKIAKTISNYRKTKKSIETTMELVSVVYSSLTSLQIKKYGHLHPAARTFQALRIYVNNEMGELEQVLANSLELLKSDDGRLCVISFHSTEDGIVKQFMKDNLQYCGVKALFLRPKRLLVIHVLVLQNCE